MYKLLLTLIISIFMGFGQQTKAQKYFVYDGDVFSVMFVCNTDNTKIDEVDFSSKDSNGEWKWNKFEIYDFLDMEDETEGGFIYYCKDGTNNKYCIDYYRTSDYLVVRQIHEDGSKSSTSWTLKRRADETK
jgi:hypothetical protein